jgi:hypothetical protein
MIASIITFGKSTTPTSWLWKWRTSLARTRSTVQKHSRNQRVEADLPRKIDGCRSFDDRINPITKLFSSGGLSFDAEKAKTYIVHQLNTGVEQNG